MVDKITLVFFLKFDLFNSSSYFSKIFFVFGNGVSLLTLYKSNIDALYGDILIFFF